MDAIIQLEDGLRVTLLNPAARNVLGRETDQSCDGGAALQLGIGPSTFKSRMKALKIVRRPAT